MNKTATANAIIKQCVCARFDFSAADFATTFLFFFPARPRIYINIHIIRVLLEKNKKQKNDQTNDLFRGAAITIYSICPGILYARNIIIYRIRFYFSPFFSFSSVAHTSPPLVRTGNTHTRVQIYNIYIYIPRKGDCEFRRKKNGWRSLWSVVVKRERRGPLKTTAGRTLPGAGVAGGKRFGGDD